jgi:broad specificity phosphatase PhoE
VQGKGIDSELNDTGKKQAHALGLRFQSEQIDLLGSSSMKRAMQTISYIAPYHQNLNINEYDDLQEMDYGNWEGRFYEPNKPDTIYADLMKLHEQWNQGETHIKIPGGESPYDVQCRTLKAINSIINQISKCGIVVCHGRAIKVILSSLLSAGLENMGKFDQNNTAVNIIEFLESESKWISIKLNCTKHLPK